VNLNISTPKGGRDTIADQGKFLTILEKWSDSPGRLEKPFSFGSGLELPQRQPATPCSVPLLKANM
jgi:hypothetical protein